MSAVDATLVFLPRPTTLIGAAVFTTPPLDVSAQGGVQFQVWRGPIRVASGAPAGSLTLLLEESLDAESWALGPSTPQGIPLLEGQVHFLSYSFRLRWFRLKFTLTGNSPFVSCWAEGLLRGGDGGLWGSPQGVASAAGMVSGHSAEADPRTKGRGFGTGSVLNRRTRRGLRDGSIPYMTPEQVAAFAAFQENPVIQGAQGAHIPAVTPGQGPALAPPSAAAAPVVPWKGP
jgi:hypothetical protein